MFAYYLSLLLLCILLFTWYRYRAPVPMRNKAKIAEVDFRNGDIILLRPAPPGDFASHFSWWWHAGVIIIKDGEPLICEFRDEGRGKKAGFVTKPARERLRKILAGGHLVAIRQVRNPIVWTSEEVLNFMDLCASKEFDKTFIFNWIKSKVFRTENRNPRTLSCASMIGHVLEKNKMPTGCFHSLSPGQFSSAYSRKWDRYFEVETYLTP